MCQKYLFGAVEKFQIYSVELEIKFFFYTSRYLSLGFR